MNLTPAETWNETNLCQIARSREETTHQSRLRFIRQIQADALRAALQHLINVNPYSSYGIVGLREIREKANQLHPIREDGK